MSANNFFLRQLEDRRQERDKAVALAGRLAVALQDLIVEMDRFGGCPQSSPAWKAARAALAAAEKELK